MKKEHVLYLLSFLFGFSGIAQQTLYPNGAITDSLIVQDSTGQTYSLFLPSGYTQDREWPLVVISDLEDKQAKALQYLQEPAEQEGYILVASNAISDNASLANNMLRTGSLIRTVMQHLAIDKDRIYVAGFDLGARFSTLIPIFIEEVDGVISNGAPIPNIEVLVDRKPFHFIGIVGRRDFTFPDMVNVKRSLSRLKFPNHLLIHDEDTEWPSKANFKKAFQIFTLSAMAKGHVEKDEAFIAESWKEDLGTIESLRQKRKLLLAEQYSGELQRIYRPLKNVDSLKTTMKAIRKEKLYKNLRRGESNALLKETLLREDYLFYLDDDISTYNFNNLGWWDFQMSELDKFINANTSIEQAMGHRLKKYVNALIEDNINVLEEETTRDETALLLLWMMKTITEPSDYDFYLMVISHSAEKEDYGTAQFYLEELLKAGFRDKDKLNTLEHTGLFRISPDYKRILDRYFKES